LRKILILYIPNLMPPKKATNAAGAKGKAKAIAKEEKKAAKTSKVTTKGKSFKAKFLRSFFYTCSLF